MNYKRETLNNNIEYSGIKDEKFKSNLCTVSFSMPIDKIEAADTTIAATYITSCNNRYRSVESLNSKTNMLFGANMYSSVFKRGDIFVFTAGINFIDDKFLPEKVTEEAISILFDSFYDPYLIDESYDSDIFERKRNDLLDAIRSEINDKARYLFIKSAATVFENEPAALPLYGTFDEAKKADPLKSRVYFENFLKNSNTTINFAGCSDVVPELIKEYSSKLSSKGSNIIYNTPSAIKTEPKIVKETLDVTQSKFIMYYKTSCTNRYIMRMFSHVLGGTPSSKLFINVREKNSLCYYCVSGYSHPKSTLIIHCGVEKNNINRAIDAIKEQIEEIKKGNISETEMSAAIMNMKNSLNSTGDTTSSYTSWLLECGFNGDFVTKEETLERYLKVTKEDIIEAANSIKLDTIYILESK